ncbi:hypothetical protein RhiirA4_469321 [Rhizophagus irregularis]|uniref:Uncharacterized protein n=1 Tax=Rhizophagus irregularis TaxID=588596 RepID=A0A2I1GZJ0_9GLOM|nr:hypothetical protein RhiirA4_469321 [Rhizophagus irregularis]
MTNISRQKNTEGSCIIDEIFIDDDKYRTLAELAGPLILHDEYLLAQHLENIKVALAFWIRRIQTSLTNNLTTRTDTQSFTTCTTSTISQAEPPQSRDNSNYATESTTLVNNKKRKIKRKDSHYHDTTDVNKGRQRHKDKLQNDLGTECPTNSETQLLKNSEHVDNVTSMKDVIPLPALDSNLQQQVKLVDFSTDGNVNTSLPVQISSLLNTNHESDNIWKDLWLLNQDVIMNDADDANDKEITNNNIMRISMDQVPSQSTSSLQEFESAIKATPNATDTNNDDTIDHKWYPPSKIKKPSKVLSDIKKHSSRNNKSIHAYTEEKIATYDAFIPINDIDHYDTIEDKISFIELNVRNISDYAGIEYNAKDKQIIIKNYVLGGMRRMVRIFNHYFKTSNFKMREKSTTRCTDNESQVENSKS